MNIDGKPWRTIWLEADGGSGQDAVGVIDQTQLPHRFTTRTLRSCEEAAEAISTMV
ncbi:MAG: S-methyl-5-thioribose-1-phosphate isomerase, partial [Cyanobacteria bacterium M_surface_10_m2_119]|nr:S-methyl-5-thioribose-1-phosphate isomerase [Cyanobacteria bacterium M_surface_10_m2_119]